MNDNITQQKCSQLFSSNERLKLALEMAGIALWDWDVETGEITFSPEMEHLCGLEANSFEGTEAAFLNLIHPLDQEAFLQALQRTRETGKDYNVDSRIISPNGDMYWIRSQGKAIQEDNEVITIAGISFEISETKQLEAALEESQYQLQETQRIGHVGNWKFDVQTQEVTWSREMFHVFGFDPDQPEPTFPQLRDTIHPDDREVWQKTVELSILHGELHQFDYRIICPDGSLRYINAKGETRQNEQGETISLYGTAMDISDRVFAQQDRDQFFSLSLELLSVIGYDGYLEQINPSWVMTLEWTQEYLTRMPWIDFVHPEDRDRTLQEFEKVVQNGEKVISLENRYRCSDGSYKWLSWNLAPSPDEEKIYAVARDITENKEAELELQKQALLIESTSDFIGIASLEGQPLFMNSGGKKLMGLDSPKASLPSSVTEFLFPEDLQRFQAEILPTVLTEGCWQGEFRLQHFQTGNAIPVNYSVFLIKDPSTGTPIALGTLSQDITERKETEAALRASETKYRELAQREALVNRLASQIRRSLNLDNIIATAVLEIYHVLGVERCNFSWYRSQENPPTWEVIKEVKDENLHSLIGSYGADGIPAATQQVLSGEMIQANDLETFPDADFQEFMKALGYTSVLVIPIRTSSERLGVLVCGHCSEVHPWTEGEVELLQAVVDQLAIAINQAALYSQTQIAATTAQQQAQELEVTLRELRRTQGQLVQSEKLSSLGQMVAGVAHEINNPVNFIYGNLTHADDYTHDLLNLIQLYQDEFPNPTPDLEAEIEAIDLEFLMEDLPKLLNSMKVGAERIREIVKSLRNFSRLDESDMKEVDIHEGIDSTLMILHHRIKAKSDRPEIAILQNYATLPKIECYPGQLNQVFMNLLSNALDALEDYNFQGSVEEMSASPATIEITTRQVNNTHIEIIITDNGGGMPESVRERLFDPFFTTKAVGKGTGLGLSISYAIVTDKHGGDLTCNSAPGEGAKFIITLPIRQAVR